MANSKTTTKFANRTDEQLADEIEQLRDELFAFGRSHAISTDEARANVSAWLDIARGIPLLGPEALAGGGRALSSDACVEVAASFILSSGECRKWLLERAGSVAGRSPGFSTLDTDARDAERARLEGEIAGCERELERRALERDRDAADAKLTALVGGEAA